MNKLQIVCVRNKFIPPYSKTSWFRGDEALAYLLIKTINEAPLHIFTDEDAVASLENNPDLVRLYKLRRRELIERPSDANLGIDDYLRMSNIPEEEGETFLDKCVSTSHTMHLLKRDFRGSIAAYFGERIRWDEIDAQVQQSARRLQEPFAALSMHQHYAGNFIVHVPRSYTSDFYELAESKDDALARFCEDVERPGKFKFDLNELLKGNLSTEWYIKRLHTDLLMIAKDPSKDLFVPFLSDTSADSEACIGRITEVLAAYALFRFQKRHGQPFPSGWHESYKRVWNSLPA